MKKLLIIPFILLGIVLAGCSNNTVTKEVDNKYLTKEVAAKFLTTNYKQSLFRWLRLDPAYWDDNIPDLSGWDKLEKDGYITIEPLKSFHEGRFMQSKCNLTQKSLNEFSTSDEKYYLVADYVLNEITGVYQESNSNEAIVEFTIKEIRYPLYVLPVFHEKGFKIDEEGKNQKVKLVKYQSGWAYKKN